MQLSPGKTIDPVISDNYRPLIDCAQQFAERITLLPLRTAQIPELLDLLVESGCRRLFVLDQKVAGIEDIGERTEFGYQVRRGDLELIVIDHHVSDPELSQLSTGVLVLRYLKDHFFAAASDKVAISHKDCDSLLSALMLTSSLPPEDRFGSAVMAADHTAEADGVADLLQAIEQSPASGEKLTTEALAYSIRQLGAFLCGEPLSSEAQKMYDDRLSARKAWEAKLGDVTKLPNGTYYYHFKEKVAADPGPEFLRTLLPDAQLILVFHNDPEKPDFLQLRAIRGDAADDHIRVDDPNLIASVVAGFGGRFDAGSNRRGGISVGDPDSVARQIDSNLGKLLVKRD